uniref:NADH dehydrogenase subunit 6 n=1 Tax=Tetragnatha maxillosa TaxID=216284 RepID=A0A0A0YUS2_9ARAC|nr:NADH dehydrogenase subunit 6 [Tetragnatha maxillosa]AIX11774.1 NADH dehydrogenase subunit 6 [Tetragnatha maxillosa]
MVMFLGVFIIWGSHPILMMGGLLVLVLSSLLYLYYNTLMFWGGYLLLMVMLSGILVIFSYMLSLVPNLAFEEFSMFMPLLLVLILVYLEMEKFYLMDFSLYIFSIWGGSLSMMTFYLVSLLLLLMVIVLHMSEMKKGSVRVV